MTALKVATRIKKGAVSKNTDIATITATYSAKGLVAAGFDTEGVNDSSAKSPLYIQVGLLVDGIAYESLVKVNYTLPGIGTTASITGPSK